jgi:CheY-like chemotaxis protein
VVDTSSPISPNDPPLARGLRILYADDMPELLTLMSELLPRDGHEIETVGDGRAALDRLRRTPGAFDLLITDHNMPGLNGLDLVRQAREVPYRGRIIVFCSEFSEFVDSQYRLYGAEHILPKPIAPPKFRALLRQMAEAMPRAEAPR